MERSGSTVECGMKNLQKESPVSQRLPGGGLMKKQQVCAIQIAGAVGLSGVLQERATRGG